MTLEGIAKKYFKENKETKELFATSDNFLFLLKKDAQNHAQTLEDSTVKCYNSSELLDESDDSEEVNQGDPTDILQLSKRSWKKHRLHRGYRAIRSSYLTRRKRTKPI